MGLITKLRKLLSSTPTLSSKQEDSECQIAAFPVSPRLSPKQYPGKISSDSASDRSGPAGGSYRKGAPWVGAGCVGQPLSDGEQQDCSSSMPADKYWSDVSIHVTIPAHHPAPPTASSSGEGHLSPRQPEAAKSGSPSGHTRLPVVWVNEGTPCSPTAPKAPVAGRGLLSAPLPLLRHGSLQLEPRSLPSSTRSDDRYSPRFPGSDRPSRTSRNSSLKGLLHLEQYTFVSDYNVDLAQEVLVSLPSSAMSQEGGTVRCSRDEPPTHGPMHTGFTQTLADQLVEGEEGGPRLLAVSPMLPLDMRRSVWSLEDYTIIKQLHKGYASEVFQVSKVAHLSRSPSFPPV